MLQVVIISAREDEPHRSRLYAHLIPLHNSGFIEVWHDGMIRPGDQYLDIIASRIQSANVLLVLLSIHLISMDQMSSHIAQLLKHGHFGHEHLLIPVKLSYFDIALTPFASLQQLPSNGKPVTTWTNHDEAWLDIASSVRRLIGERYSIPSIVSPSLPMETHSQSLLLNLPSYDFFGNDSNVPHPVTDLDHYFSLIGKAKNLEDTIEMLRNLHLVLNNQFEMIALWRIGKHFAVFRGQEIASSQRVAIKMPMHDYGRPASFGLRAIENARTTTIREWSVLCRLRAAKIFPAPIALLTELNPLLVKRGGNERSHFETFLIQEWIEGDTLDDIRLSVHREKSDIMRIEKTFNDCALALLKSLASLSPHLFADISPRNFIVCRATGCIKIVDAGSVVSSGAILWSFDNAGQFNVRIPVTLCYLPANLVQHYRKKESCLFDSVIMLKSVGKMLYELATNLHPLDATDPSPTAFPFKSLSKPVRDLIIGLLHGRWTDPTEVLHDVFPEDCQRPSVTIGREE